ncbi:nuclear condensing complex subunit [Schizophyllum amplum]|uniref:Nuclear condensing complex subunit n=1 Tax=Schizophyllum amplum TaxID=97359 RepID=A0A550CDI8_9AGAR|nr:nuclear condensing complex subunit [Auriculariopsis ampla]
MPARTLSRNDSQLITGGPFTERLKRTLDGILSQVQDNIQNHSKNQVALYKLHFEAQSIPKVTEGGHGRISGERLFSDVFDERLSSILDIPKKPQHNKVDRVIQFIGSYIKYMNEKAAEDTRAEGEDEDEDNFASRFTAHLIEYILQGYHALNKTVRLRVLQITTAVISHLGTIDGDLYDKLRDALRERAGDKENSVRTQVVMSLCKIVDTPTTEDTEYDEDVESELLEMLAVDTAAEVRRAILLNLPLTEVRLAGVLTRLREEDAVTRRLIYAKTLALEGTTDGETSIANPRVLNWEQVENIVKHGLNDRDESVRTAAGRLMTTWYDEMGTTIKAEAGKRPVSEIVQEQMVAFLSLFHLQAEGRELAQKALEAVFRARPDGVDNLRFDERFWRHLTPESALLARVFVDHCRARDSARLDAAMTEVHTLAGTVQTLYNALLEDIDNERHGLSYAPEDLRAAQDTKILIIDQVLQTISLMPIDHYGGQITAKMMRAMLENEQLPEKLIPRCLDVLREVVNNERDLIMRVVEIVDELRDPASERGVEGEEEQAQDPDASQDDMDPNATPMAKPPWNDMFKKPVAELTEKEQQRVDAVDLKCLTLLQCVLERVEETLENNTILMGPTASIIMPAIARENADFREKGLLCLGLICLISLEVAKRSIGVFLQHLHDEDCPDDLRATLVMTLFDVLLAHRHFFVSKPMTEHVGKLMTMFYSMMQDADTDPKLLAVLGHGLMKVVLAGMISAARTDGREEGDDEDEGVEERSSLELAIRNLIVSYTDPTTSGNQPLLQCLHHALGVFAHTSAGNKDIMRHSFRPVYKRLCETFHDGVEDALEPSKVADMFLEWTDPERASALVKEHMSVKEWSVQLDLARDIMRMLLQDTELEKDERKALCSMLSAIYLPDDPDVDPLKVQRLKILAETVLRGRRPPPGQKPREQVEKFDRALEKKYAVQLEGFSREDARQQEQFRSVFEFVDGILDEEEEEDAKPARRAGARRSASVATTEASTGLVAEEEDVKPVIRKTRKRRAESVTSSATEGDRSKPASKRKAKAKAKRRRTSTSDEDTEVDEPPAPVQRTRRSTRNAAKKKEVINLITDEEDAANEAGSAAADDDDFVVEATPKVKPRRRGLPVNVGGDVDRDISALLGRGGPRTSGSLLNSAEDVDSEDEVIGSLLSLE